MLKLDYFLGLVTLVAILVQFDGLLYNNFSEFAFGFSSSCISFLFFLPHSLNSFHTHYKNNYAFQQDERVNYLFVFNSRNCMKCTINPQCNIFNFFSKISINDRSPLFRFSILQRFQFFFYHMTGKEDIESYSNQDDSVSCNN